MTDDNDFDVTADGVETTDSSSTDGVYANPEKADAEGVAVRSFRGDSADEVDPRRLYRDPTLSELRWYYRRTDLGGVLVDKPIEDAFKHGFEFTEPEETELSEPQQRIDDANDLISSPKFYGDGEGFIGAHILAEKKARRDGFALIFIGTEERNSSGLGGTPVSNDVDVTSISHLKVLTIDDLTHGAPHDEIQRGTGLDRDEYEIRRTGIVVNTDLNSPDYHTPVGYVLDDGASGKFVHADRVLHYVWNPEVDGDYKNDDTGGIARFRDRNTTIGGVEGDSILLKSYDILKGISKGNWAIMQALFRNAAHMYTVEMPEDADEEDQAEAEMQFTNLNAKSEVIHPYGYDVTQHESGGEMEPRDHFDVLFDQICAGHEMTKSVLFGTQTGTVSGSETDIKNYFNQIERYRETRATGAIKAYLTRAKSMLDSRTSDDYEYEIGIDWGPLFKLDRDTRMGVFQTQAQALTTLIGTYVITPDEARELLSEEWTEIDYDDLTEGQMDILDRIRLASSGQGPQALASEGEYTNAPGGEAVAAGSGQAAGATSPQEEGGATGGMEQGQQTASENPAADAVADALADSDFADRVAEKVAERLVEDD